MLRRAPSFRYTKLSSGRTAVQIAELLLPAAWQALLELVERMRWLPAVWAAGSSLMVKGQPELAPMTVFTKAV
jgi:hypothetical protein